MPKVSVVIPVYNAENYIEKCLDSVLSQTLSDIEIICVDDGSTDSSADILRRYQRRNGHIIILNQQNRYVGAARNAGIAAAKGAYIHFLDADDWIEQSTYEVLVREIESSQAEVCVCFHEAFHEAADSESQEKLGRVPRFLVKDAYRISSNLFKHPSYFLHNTVVPWNKIYQRNFLVDNHIRFQNLISAEDRAFYIQTLLCAKKITVINEYFIHHRINNSHSLSGDTRLHHFYVSFLSMDRVLELTSDTPDNIRRLAADASIIDIMHFYSRAPAPMLPEIRHQIAFYLKSLDLTFLGDLKNYRWYKQYQEILAFTDKCA